MKMLQRKQRVRALYDSFDPMILAPDMQEVYVELGFHLRDVIEVCSFLRLPSWHPEGAGVDPLCLDRPELVQREESEKED